MMEQEYRYICAYCLKTFLDDIVEYDRFCFTCGEDMIPITDESAQILKDWLYKKVQENAK